MIRPLQNKVLLKPLKQDFSTPSGIVFADSNESRTELALVVSIGKTDDIEVKPNDKVIINKGTGIFIKFEEEDFIIADYDSILGVLD